MARVQVSSDESVQVMEVQNGTTLLDLEGIFPFGCRAGACGRCRLVVEEGMESLNAVGTREARGLRLFGQGDTRVRLACQLKVGGDCHLRLEGMKK